MASWCCLFFFFKQKTAYEMRISDWSSDVCSSDLGYASHHNQLNASRRATADLVGDHRSGSSSGLESARIPRQPVPAWRDGMYLRDPGPHPANSDAGPGRSVRQEIGRANV